MSAMPVIARAIGRGRQRHVPRAGILHVVPHALDHRRVPSAPYFGDWPDACVSIQSSTFICFATACCMLARSMKLLPFTMTYTGVVWATAPLKAVVRAAIHWLSAAGNSKSAISLSCCGPGDGIDLITFPSATISSTFGAPIDSGAQACAWTCSLASFPTCTSSPGIPSPTVSVSMGPLVTKVRPRLTASNHASAKKCRPFRCTRRSPLRPPTGRDNPCWPWRSP